MKSMQSRYIVHGMFIGFFALIAAAPAAAQSQQAGGQLEAAQVPQAPRAQSPLPAQVEAPYWSLNSGFEGDSHATGYGFLGTTFHKPIRPNVQLVVGGNVNYLYYEFQNGAGGLTSVTSPGVSAKGGVRLGDRNWVQFTAGPSFKRKHRQIADGAGNVLSTSTDIEPGFSVGADTWINPSRVNNIHGMLNYGTEDGYVWGRVGFKQQVSNIDWRNRFTHYLGAEYIGQGNEDIRSNQFGGFVEFLHAPSTVSIMVKGGYKVSTFEVGPNKTGPYFALSFYKSVGKQ